MEIEDIRNKKLGKGSLKVQNFTPQLCQIIFPGKKYQNKMKFSRNKGLLLRLEMLIYKHKTVGKSNQVAVYVKQSAMFGWLRGS